MAAALVSAHKNQSVPRDTLLFGEIGLTGEVRRVGNPERRIGDAINLGFRRFIIPEVKLTQKFEGVEIVKVSTLTEALKEIF